MILEEKYKCIAFLSLISYIIFPSPLSVRLYYSPFIYLDGADNITTCLSMEAVLATICSFGTWHWIWIRSDLTQWAEDDPPPPDHSLWSYMGCIKCLTISIVKLQGVCKKNVLPLVFLPWIWDSKVEQWSMEVI